MAKDYTTFGDMCGESTICAFAALYEKREERQTVQRIIAIILPYQEGDDEFTMKARAERYVKQNEELRTATKGMTLVAYSYSIEVT